MRKIPFSKTPFVDIRVRAAAGAEGLQTEVGRAFKRAPPFRAILTKKVFTNLKVDEIRGTKWISR